MRQWLLTRENQVCYTLAWSCKDMGSWVEKGISYENLIERSQNFMLYLNDAPWKTFMCGGHRVLEKEGRQIFTMFLQLSTSKAEGKLTAVTWDGQSFNGVNDQGVTEKYHFIPAIHTVMSCRKDLPRGLNE